MSYKYPNVFALRRPTWDVNPTRSIDDFKISFYKDPLDSLMRFACMPTEISDSFFKSKEKIEKCLSTHNPVSENRIFDSSFIPNPETVYYAHADLAQRHDKCAVAISHVEKWVEIAFFNNYHQVVPFIVVDAIAWWEPKREGPVDLSDVKNWIINLRRMGLNLGMVSFDRWNSFDIQRDLKAVGINTATLSVGKKHYEDLAMLFYEERISGPYIQLLIEELCELRITAKNNVDHPRKGSKDLSDALCGSVYNAISLSKREDTDEIEIHTPFTVSEKQKTERGYEEKDGIYGDVKEFFLQYKLL